MKHLLRYSKQSALKLVLGFLLSGAVVSESKAETVVFTTDRHIRESDKSFEGQDIVIDGTTVTIDGRHQFNSLIVSNGAVVTHSAGWLDGLHLIIAEELSVTASSRIDVTGKGNGPTTDISISGSSGGSYGGYGGAANGEPGDTYGEKDYRNPSHLGTGGWDTRTNTDGMNTRGGGAIRIEANEINLEGVIKADGEQALQSSQGAGSGGSIWIEAGVINGTGEVKANGGRRQSNRRSNIGGGGGGRIAIYYRDPGSFDLLHRVRCFGGIGRNEDKRSAAGTVYLEKTGMLREPGKLLIDNGSGHQDVIRLGTNITSSLIITNATVEVFVPLEISSLDVLGRGTLTHRAGVSNALSVVAAGRVFVAEGGKIDASGKGNGPNDKVKGASGGSYGGRGGVLGTEAENGGTNEQHGDYQKPVELGVGGSGGAPGGGSIRIKAEELVLDGMISSDGAQGTLGGGSGGSIWLDLGVLTVSKGGMVTARGGISRNDSIPSGGGGGGRISISYREIEGFDLDDQAEAPGGYSVSGSGISKWGGAAGTVFLSKSSLPESGILIINNDRFALGKNTDASTEIEDRIDVPLRVEAAKVTAVSSEEKPVKVPELVVASDGILTHLANASDTVSLEVSGLFAVASSGEINVNAKGAGPSADVTGTSGGSHGGLGGVAGVNGKTNEQYGDPKMPVNLGTGGAGGAPGGGAVRIKADEFVLDGRIWASGESSGLGGGSGGSVWLDLGVLRLASHGRNQIFAGGGHAGNSGGGGGGGRVAVYYRYLDENSPNLDSLASVSGGAGRQVGEKGTYLHSSLDGQPLIVLSTQPGGVVTNPIDKIEVRFISQIDPETFTNEDVTLTRRSNEEIEPQSITKISDVTYSINFITPIILDGIYELRVGPNITTLDNEVTMEDEAKAMDHNRDNRPGMPDDAYESTFLLDVSVPSPPEIGNYILAPTTNNLAKRRITLVGTRDVDTSVWIDGHPRILFGSGLWSYNHYFDGQGAREISLFSRDKAGNQSETVVLNFLVDTEVPEVRNLVSPPHNSSTNRPPTEIIISFSAGVSGLDVAQSLVLLSSDDELIEGISEQSGNRLIFTPLSELKDGVYTVEVRLQDVVGNRSSLRQFTFTVDTKIPLADVVLRPPDGRRDGLSVFLDWRDYDSSINGVIGYEVLRSDASFTSASDAVETNLTHMKSFTWTNLMRNTTHYFGVIPVDRAGNKPNSISSSVKVVTVDITPPRDPKVHEMEFDSRHDSLTLRWKPVADIHDDLDSYKVYFQDERTGTEIGADNLEYTRGSLQPATSYLFRVTSVDNDGNESEGTEKMGYTWLANPTNIVAEPHDSFVTLDWEPILPEGFVDHYEIFHDINDFESIEGRSPSVDVRNSTNAEGRIEGRVGGLDNFTEYYFAVVTVNKSDGRNTNIVTVSSIPLPDEKGPSITALRFEDRELVDGFVVEEPGTIFVEATDFAGISRVEFSIDGTTRHVATSESGVFGFYWNVAFEEDRTSLLRITAFDSLGNHSMATREVEVQVTAPAEAPVIAEPIEGRVFNRQEIIVRGRAPPFTSVRVFVQDTSKGSAQPVHVSAEGTFSVPINLAEGTNRIVAIAFYREGKGRESEPIRVVLDSSLPKAPENLTAEALSLGRISLSWRSPDASSIQTYKLYRSSDRFTSPSSATLVNTNNLVVPVFVDEPLLEGTHYYRVSVVNLAGTESPLSNLAKVESDRTEPFFTNLSIEPANLNVYRDKNKVGPGLVRMHIQVSEPLSNNPFVSLTPQGGLPITARVTPIGDTAYEALLQVLESTPTGVGSLFFSGRDLRGNRGTGTEVLFVDTDGPEVVALDLVPEAPIRNSTNSPVTVDVALTLNTNDFPNAQGPVLSYTLSEQHGVEPEAILLKEDNLVWAGSFTLPPTAGRETEMLRFHYEAVDELGNTNDQLKVDHDFEVYQGRLPPLEAPHELRGTSLPEGRVLLEWTSVDGASKYNVYRQSPQETMLTLLSSSVEGNLEFLDAPLEGTNFYAVTSIREIGTQTSESEKESNVVSVLSDGSPPEPPKGLSLELASKGVRADWTPSLSPDTDSYRLYRADAIRIENVAELEPLVSLIKESSAIDPDPDIGEQYYVVTAMDKAGNESVPSNVTNLNFQLVPINRLSIELDNDSAPMVSWDHKYESKFQLETHPDDLGEPLVLFTNRYEDFNYDGGRKAYTVTAVDRDENLSLPRSIVLPPLSVELDEDKVLKRGVMNQLVFKVTNPSSMDIRDLELLTSVGTQTNRSGPFEVEANSFSSITNILGGSTNLADMVGITTTLSLKPNKGEEVSITRNSIVAVKDDHLALDILNESFTRGGSGPIRLVLKNTGEADIEVITATRGGNEASPEIRVKLIDLEGNPYSISRFKQDKGLGIFQLSNGESVARVSAGESYTSSLFTDLFVPTNVPSRVWVEVEVDQIHYNRGGANEISIEGLAARREIAVVDTPYEATVEFVEPSVSMGEEPIRIRGYAEDRMSNRIAGAPVRLTVRVNGVERSILLKTKQNGTFEYDFVPNVGESGLYEVWALHPDRRDKPKPQTFIINQLLISPSVINAVLPQTLSRTNTIPFTVKAGEATTIRDLYWEYLPDDQPGGEFDPGLVIRTNTQSVVSLLHPNEEGTLEFEVHGLEGGKKEGTAILRVVSESTHWGNVQLNYTFVEPQPRLVYDPPFLEVGMAPTNALTEVITLKNVGFDTMKDIQFSLVDADEEQAPDWITLDSPATIRRLEPEQERAVQIGLMPEGKGVLEGDYTFFLRVSGFDMEEVNIGIYVTITESGEGNVLFKVLDIYTGTFDENGNLSEGVSNALIRLEYEEPFRGEQELVAKTTDAAGEVLFEGLRAGRYRFRATAPQHNGVNGRFRVRPGITETKEVILDFDLVSVQWEVVPITIEDRYEIRLEATYETDVPAPVLEIEPLSINLPKMIKGDVFNGEVKIRNLGLIRADNLQFLFPDSDNYFKFEHLAGLPLQLQPKEEITVPYRVTCLLSPDDDPNAQFGGGSYRRCTFVRYEFESASRRNFKSQGRWCWIYTLESVPLDNVNLDDSAASFDLALGDGFRLPELSREPQSLSGGEACWECPDPGCSTCCCEGGSDTVYPLMGPSEVDLRIRSYLDRVVDLRLGEITIERRFDGRHWRWGAVVGKDPALSAYYIKQDGSPWQVNAYYFGSVLSNAVNGTDSPFILAELFGQERLVGVRNSAGIQVIEFEYNSSGYVSAIKDSARRFVAYEYSGSKLQSVTDVLGHQVAYTYGGHGKMTRETDPEGRERTIHYNDQADLFSVTNKNGHGEFFAFDYDARNKEYYALVQSSSGKEKEVWFRKDGTVRRVEMGGTKVTDILKDRQVEIVTDAYGNRTRFEFDSSHKLRKVIYPGDLEASFTYEPRYNHLTEVMDASGIGWAYEYNTGGFLTNATIDVAGDRQQYVFEYDDQDRIIRFGRAGGSQANSAGYRFTYLRDSLLSEVMDSNGKVYSNLVYDGRGNLRELRDPKGLTWRYSYDLLDRLIEGINLDGSVVKLGYDSRGNITNYLNPLAWPTSYTYNEDDRLLSVTDSHSHTVSIVDSPDRRPIAIFDQSDKQVYQAQYDRYERVREVTEGDQFRTTYTYGEVSPLSPLPIRIEFPSCTVTARYGALERPLHVTKASSQEQFTIYYSYDALGRPIAQTNSEGEAMFYAYDPFHRVTSMTNSLGASTHYQYDTFGRLSGLTDAASNTWTLIYDEEDRVERLLNSSMAEPVLTLSYDGVGNKTSSVDAKGQEVRWHYNSAGQVTQTQHFAQSGNAEPDRAFSLAYDKAGNLKAYEEESHAAFYQYDALDRLTNEIQHLGSMVLTNSYTYYANGFMRTYTDSQGFTYKYNYSEDNQLSSLTIPGQGQITYGRYTWTGSGEDAFPEIGPCIDVPQTSFLLIARYHAKPAIPLAA